MGQLREQKKARAFVILTCSTSWTKVVIIWILMSSLGRFALAWSIARLAVASNDLILQGYARALMNALIARQAVEALFLSALYQRKYVLASLALLRVVPLIAPLLAFASFYWQLPSSIAYCVVVSLAFCLIFATFPLIVVRPDGSVVCGLTLLDISWSVYIFDPYHQCWQEEEG